MTTDESLLVDRETLHAFVRRVLGAAGAAPDAARLCAEVFVHADLHGTDTHGVARLGQYVEAMRSGRVDGHAQPRVVADSGAVVSVDAANALGPVGLGFATDLAVRTAREHGVGVVTVRGSNHAGSMGWYLGRAAEAGMFAMILTGSTKAMVTPPRGTQPFLGTNALSFTMPTGGPALTFDTALSAGSRSELERRERTGEALPDSWATGPDGQPATDPAEVIAGIDALTGHSLLPFGGEFGQHKGFGISLLVELLCGPMAGGRFGPRTPESGPAGVGHFILCLGPDAFNSSGADVEKSAGELCDRLREVRPGVPGESIRLPGDRSRACAERRAAEGIPLPAVVLADLDRTARRVGAALLDLRRRPPASPPRRAASTSLGVPDDL